MVYMKILLPERGADTRSGFDRHGEQDEEKQGLAKREAQGERERGPQAEGPYQAGRAADDE